MKKKFIEFNDIDSGIVAINTEHLVSVVETDMGEGVKLVSVTTTDGDVFRTHESFRDVCNKLEDDNESSDL
jgi:hypothetical protein